MKRKRLCDRQTPISTYTPSNSAIKFIEDRSVLPFPGASRRLYQKQNKITNTNVKCTKQRGQVMVLRNDTIIIGIQRSRVEGSLEDNIEDIKRELLS